MSSPLKQDGDDDEDAMQCLLDTIIGEDYIVQQTGITDLSKIIHLQLSIDTSQQSIFELSDLLPNLQHLELDNSTIASVRDLGIGLRRITSLSLATCGLNDLDGIGVLTGLQELNLSNNYITDVTPLAIHENLQNLNLSNNRLAELSFADALSSCPKLRSLFLTRNPVCRARSYRSVVASLIPTLDMLDGSPVDAAAAKKVTNGMILEAAAELRVVEEELDDELRLENEILDMEQQGQHQGRGGIGISIGPNIGGMPTAPTGHNWSPARRAQTQKGGSGSGMGMSIGGHSSPGYPNRRTDDGTDLAPDTGSELTHGSSVVLAGGMAAAVRKRRQRLGSAGSSSGCDSGDSSAASSRPGTGGTGTSAASSRSGSRGGLGVALGGAAAVGAEPESALQVLDAALRDARAPSAANSSSSSSNSSRPADGVGVAVCGQAYEFMEGDVTAALCGNSHMYNEQHSSHHPHRSHASQGLKVVTSSLESGGDLFEEEEDLPEVDSAHSRPHSSHSRPHSRQPPSRPPSGSCTGTSRFSPRGGSGGAIHGEVGGQSGRPPRSGGGHDSGLHVHQLRPRSAAGDDFADASISFSRSGSASGSGRFLGGDDSGREAASQDVAPGSSSPRQRNSSRPQSAVGAAAAGPGTLSGSLLVSALAAPFKVAVDKSQLTATAPASAAAVSARVVEEEGALWVAGAGRGGGVRGPGMAAGPTAPTPRAAGTGTARSSGHATGLGVGQTSSLVHLDIVQRNTKKIKSTGKDKQQLRRGSDSGSDSDDSEGEVALSHADRRRLMNASSMHGRADSTLASMKQRRQILLQLQGTSTTSAPTTATSAAEGSGARTRFQGEGEGEGEGSVDAEALGEAAAGPDTESTTLREPLAEALLRSPEARAGAPTHHPSGSTGNNTLSSGARAAVDSTSALYRSPPSGIASRGSRRGGLSAESDDSDNDDGDDDGVAGRGRSARGHACVDVLGAVAKHSSSSKAGISLGFNLAGSLAAIDKWVHDMSSDEDDDDDDDDDGDDGEEGDEEADERDGGAAGAGAGAGARTTATLTNDKARGASDVASAASAGGRRQDPSSALDAASRDSGSASELSSTYSASKVPKSRVLSRDAIYHMCSSSAQKDRDSGRAGSGDGDRTSTGTRRQGSGVSFVMESDDYSNSDSDGGGADSDDRDDREDFYAAQMVAALGRGGHGTGSWGGGSGDGDERDSKLKRGIPARASTPDQKLLLQPAVPLPAVGQSTTRAQGLTGTVDELGFEYSDDDDQDGADDFTNYVQGDADADAEAAAEVAALQHAHRPSQRSRERARAPLSPIVHRNSRYLAASTATGSSGRSLSRGRRRAHSGGVSQPTSATSTPTPTPASSGSAASAESSAGTAFFSTDAPSPAGTVQRSNSGSSSCSRSSSRANRSGNINGGDIGVTRGSSGSGGASAAGSSGASAPGPVPDFAVNLALPVPDDSSPQRSTEEELVMTPSTAGAVRITAIDATASSAATVTKVADEPATKSSRSKVASAPPSLSGSAGALALTMGDAELVELLRRPPKTTEVLRTKSAFQAFFRGVSGERMRALLAEAYADLPDRAERNAKIDKRMALLRDVVV